jgi:hypothetical protein
MVDIFPDKNLFRPVREGFPAIPEKLSRVSALR